MKSDTTPGQQRVLEFIQRTIQESGTSPTLQEIAAEFGKSTGAIQTSLKALQSKGFIEIIPRKSRGIRLAEKAAIQDLRVTQLKAALESTLEESPNLAALFRATQESLPKVFEMEAGVLWVRDPARRRFLGPRELGIDPPTAFAFPDELPIRFQARAEPLLVLDRKRVNETSTTSYFDARARSFIVIPIVDLDQLLGILVFQSSQPHKGETEEVVEAANEASRILSAPIRRAAAQFGLEEDLKLHRMLLKIVKELAGELDLKNLLRRVFDHIERSMPVDSMWIAIRKDDGTYETVLETDLDDSDKRIFFPVPRIMEPDRSRVLATIDKERYVLVNRTAEELQKLHRTSAKGDPWWAVGNPNRRSASMLFVPIWFGAEWKGAMSVQSYRMNAYRHEDAERLHLIGEYVGLAVRNAQLFSELKRSGAR